MENSIDCNIYIQFTRNKKISISELIYLASFSLYTICCMLDTTMFKVYIPYKLDTLVTLISLGLILFKILFLDRYSFSNIISISMFISVIFIAAFVSKYKNLIYLAFMIIGAKNIQFKKIAKVYLWIIVTITILAMIAARLNLIENIIYYRNGLPRYSFGSVYCTDFAAHIFYIVLCYFYIKDNNLSYFNILVFALLGWFVSYYCGARLDSLCIFLLCIFLVYLKIKKKKFNKNGIGFIWKFILIFSIPISAIISILFTNMYNPTDNMFYKLNILLSNRLKYGKMGIYNYGFSLFGQQVVMKGNGGTTKFIENYFFIDSSYLLIALRYGVVVLSIFCIYFIFLNRRMLKKKNIIIPIIIVFIAINSIIAHHLIDLAYNPFILCFFSKVESNYLEIIS